MIVRFVSMSYEQTIAWRWNMYDDYQRHGRYFENTAKKQHTAVVASMLPKAMKIMFFKRTIHFPPRSCLIDFETRGSPCISCSLSQLILFHAFSHFLDDNTVKECTPIEDCDGGTPSSWVGFWSGCTQKRICCRTDVQITEYEILNRSWFQKEPLQTLPHHRIATYCNTNLWR